MRQEKTQKRLVTKTQYVQVQAKKTIVDELARVSLMSGMGSIFYTIYLLFWTLAIFT